MKVLDSSTRSYVQCVDCMRVLKPRGDKNSPLITRLESTATRHEQLHPQHRVTLFIKSEELPIVAEMRTRFESQKK